MTDKPPALSIQRMIEVSGIECSPDDVPIEDRRSDMFRLLCERSVSESWVPNFLNRLTTPKSTPFSAYMKNEHPDWNFLVNHTTWAAIYPLPKSDLSENNTYAMVEYLYKVKAFTDAVKFCDHFKVPSIQRAAIINRFTPSLTSYTYTRWMIESPTATELPSNFNLIDILNSAPPTQAKTPEFHRMVLGTYPPAVWKQYGVTERQLITLGITTSMLPPGWTIRDLNDQFPDFAATHQLDSLRKAPISTPRIGVSSFNR